MRTTLKFTYSLREGGREGGAEAYKQGMLVGLAWSTTITRAPTSPCTRLHLMPAYRARTYSVQCQDVPTDFLKDNFSLQ